MKPARIERKTAIGMEELVRMYIDSMKISSGLNTQLIYSAWDQASGAADYTIKKYFRAGKLYVTLSSSVVRNQLSFQKEALREKINQLLSSDKMFTKDDPRVTLVQEIILK